MFRRFRSYSTLKKFRITCLFFCLFLFFLFFLSNRAIIANAEGKTYTSVREIPENRVGLLLGTSKVTRRGGENQYYSFRIDATAALFRAGKIKYILISGDNSTKDYDEPTTMKKDLVAKGIPAKRIYLDYAGFRTLDSMERALKVFGLKKVTIISQKFHNERAIYLAESLGMEAIGFNARNVTKYSGFKTAVRERFARIKVFIDLWTNKGSKFLGKPVKIG